MLETRLIDTRDRLWRVQVPQAAVERVRGLLGRDGLDADQGMLFRGTRSVHTIGMRFPIAVIFLDRDLTVLQVRAAPKGRAIIANRRATHLLEAPADADLRQGDAFRVAPGSPPV